MPDTAIATATVGVDACHAMAPVSSLYRGTEEGEKGVVGWAMCTVVTYGLKTR